MKSCAHENVNRMTADNAVCLSCGQHWYAGKEYTRKAWDALLDDCLLKEVLSSSCAGCPVAQQILAENVS